MRPFVDYAQLFKTLCLDLGGRMYRFQRCVTAASVTKPLTVPVFATLRRLSGVIVGEMVTSAAFTASYCDFSSTQSRL